ncbi:MAG TPA: GNAT family N-acetyltransferase [Actinomycetota bacterium]|nr:GNAT family N-acetyltransferase [Actinomycetota bacterium]
MNEDLSRAVVFERSVLERTATRAEAFAWGTAYFNDRFPLSYYNNSLWVDRAGATAEALVLEADRLLGGAGLAHRELFVPEEEIGDALTPRFKELGWEAHRHLYMAHRRAPDREAEAGLVEEVAWDEIRPAVEAQVRADPHMATSEEAIRQLVDRKDGLRPATRARHFVARVAGRIGSFCDLYVDGRTAQIEDVFTFEDFRGRGLASSVVLRALAIARAEGHDLVFLVADPDDWPKELYRKLGFDQIGLAWVLALWPAGGG